MNRKLIFITLLLVVIGATTAFFGCNLSGLAGSNNYSRFASLGSYDDGTVSIPSQKFFYIRIARASDGLSQFLQHALYEEKAGPGTDCKIPVDEESTEDMYCMLEKMEGDLWAHDTIIEYNVPAGMCKYLAFTTHWHWNQNAGPGPSNVYKCKSGTGNDSSELYSASCTHCGRCEVTERNNGRDVKRACNQDNQSEINDRDNWTDPFCTNADKISCKAKGEGEGICTNTKKELEELCPHNLSKQEEDLSDCCTGSYNGFGGAENGEWGESLENCIGGLGRISWDAKTKEGIPKTLVVNADQNGYIDTYKIPSIESWYDDIAILSIGKKIISGSPREVSGPSFVTANYYEGIEDDTNDKPNFYKSDYVNRPGNPYITWACLDSAHEVMHRIHLIIREWNSQEEFLKFRESEGSRGDPDIKGSEGGDCEYYNQAGRSFGECNDAVDADDWKNDDRDFKHPLIIYK